MTRRAEAWAFLPGLVLALALAQIPPSQANAPHRFEPHAETCYHDHSLLVCLQTCLRNGPRVCPCGDPPCFHDPRGFHRSRHPPYRTGPSTSCFLFALPRLGEAQAEVLGVLLQGPLTFLSLPHPMLAQLLNERQSELEQQAVLEECGQVGLG